MADFPNLDEAVLALEAKLVPGTKLGERAPDVNDLFIRIDLGTDEADVRVRPDI